MRKRDLSHSPASVPQRSRGPTEKCSYFVSHSWRDDGNKKVDMLRSFLSVQQLVARLVRTAAAPSINPLAAFSLGEPNPFCAVQVVCIVLVSAFSIPLFAAVGTVGAEAIEVRAEYLCTREGDCDASRQPRDSPLLRTFLVEWLRWVPPLVLVGLLLLARLWIKLSYMEVPLVKRFAPWRFSSLTLWLDKCCVKQDSKETIASGTASFGAFLGRCDKMIAFVSPHYFTRLWSVLNNLLAQDPTLPSSPRALGSHSQVCL